MKTFFRSFSLITTLTLCFLLFFTCACEKDNDNDNNNNGEMWDPGWLIGTWEGTTPQNISPWGGTMIRIVFESYNMVEHDTLPGGVRKAYSYTGSFTWDVEGTSPWSHQFLQSNYPIPDFNVILWDCLKSSAGQTMNNISLRVGDDYQTDPLHLINLDCGPVIDETGNAPGSIEFYGDVEIQTNGIWQEAQFPPNQGSMITMTKK